jgi:hypothetical protein
MKLVFSAILGHYEVILDLIANHRSTRNSILLGGSSWTLDD